MLELEQKIDAGVAINGITYGCTKQQEENYSSGFQNQSLYLKWLLNSFDGKMCIKFVVLRQIIETLINV